MKERVDGAHHGQKQDGQRGSTTPIQQLVRINGYEVGDHLITTATDQLTAAKLDEFPLSGRLFVAHVGAVGLPVAPWSGR